MKEFNKDYLIAIIVIVIIIVSIGIQLNKSKKNYFKKENYKEKTVIKDEKNKVGKLNFVIDNLKYNYGDKDENYEYKNYENDDYQNHCTLDIDRNKNYEFNGYKNGKDVLENEVNVIIKEKVSEIEEKDINGSKWYKVDITKEGEPDEYRTVYASIYKGSKYTITYKFYDYVKGDSKSNKKEACETSLDTLISSLKFDK